ncbi:hypothetical protein ACIQT3_18895 [Enterobacter sichuanensis]|uniref:hypothetical protein n=1 Tax=Enterobacter sichuanensis TaxID=2071710 RepID=UPI00383A3F55
MDSYQSGQVPCGAKQEEAKQLLEAATQLISYDIEYTCVMKVEKRLSGFITNPTIASTISIGSTSWAMR